LSYSQRIQDYRRGLWRTFVVG